MKSKPGFSPGWRHDVFPQLLSLKRDPIAWPEQSVPDGDTDSAKGQGKSSVELTGLPHSEANSVGGRVNSQVRCPPNYTEFKWSYM